MFKGMVQDLFYVLHLKMKDESVVRATGRAPTGWCLWQCMCDPLPNIRKQRMAELHHQTGTTDSREEGGWKCEV